MRTSLALCAVLIAGATACGRSAGPRAPAPPMAEPAASPAPTSRVPPAAVSALAPSPTPHLDVVPDFEREVRPILAGRCEPCHVPGGKMYDRMPFDDASVVASHSAGILKRLKGDDRAVVERWIASRPAAR